ncbi:MAG: ABC transporter permease [Chloroflexi bacterium]|nr:ABC transporter permease [Chloroflexota bacterium]
MSASVGIQDAVSQSRATRGKSIWRRIWLHRIGIVGIIIMTAFVIAAVFGGWLAPKDPVAIDLKNPLAKPIWADTENGVGFLGTDNLGRDVLSRMLVGSQLSLIVAFSAVSIGMVSGVFLGLLTGFKGGKIDDVIMRIADTQTAIPFLVLLIAVIAFLGGGLLNMIVFIGIGSWVGFARLIRGEVLSIRERDYVHAARALGVGDLRIMLRHIMPNAIQPAIVGASLAFGGVILTEAALSFLGLGVNTLVPTWGKMIADSRDYITLAWHLNFPAVAIMLVVLGANLLGDWLRDILDPRLRGRRG